MSQSLYLDSSNFKAAGLSTTSLDNLHKKQPMKKTLPLNHRDSVNSNHSQSTPTSFHPQQHAPHAPKLQHSVNHPNQPPHQIHPNNMAHGNQAPPVHFNPSYQQNIQHNYQALEIKYTNLLNQSKQKENFIKLLSKENKLLNTTTAQQKQQIEELTALNDEISSKASNTNSLSTNISNQLRRLVDQLTKYKTTKVEIGDEFYNELISSEISLTDSSIFSNSPLTPYDDDFKNISMENTSLIDNDLDINEMSGDYSSSKVKSDFNSDTLAKLTNKDTESTSEASNSNLGSSTDLDSIIEQLSSEIDSVVKLKSNQLNMKIMQYEITSVNELIKLFIKISEEKNRLSEFLNKINTAIIEGNFEFENVERIEEGEKFMDNLTEVLKHSSSLTSSPQSSSTPTSKSAHKQSTTNVNHNINSSGNEDENIYQTEFNKIKAYQSLLTKKETTIKNLLSLNLQEKRISKKLSSALPSPNIPSPTSQYFEPPVTPGTAASTPTSSEKLFRNKNGSGLTLISIVPNEFSVEKGE